MKHGDTPHNATATTLGQDTHRTEGIELLNDADLLRVEAHRKQEYARREQLHPQRHNTTYRVLEGSAELLHAWKKWREAQSALRRRGLPSGCNTPRAL